MSISTAAWVEFLLRRAVAMASPHFQVCSRAAGQTPKRRAPVRGLTLPKFNGDPGPGQFPAPGQQIHNPGKFAVARARNQIQFGLRAGATPKLFAPSNLTRVDLARGPRVCNPAEARVKAPVGNCVGAARDALRCLRFLFPPRRFSREPAQTGGRATFA